MCGPLSNLAISHARIQEFSLGEGDPDLTKEKSSDFFSQISEECQAVWVQNMPVGPDLGPNCLQTTLVSKVFMTTIQAN